MNNEEAVEIVGKLIRRHSQNPAANLAESVDLSGLGQLVEATIQSDRVITFGN